MISVACISSNGQDVKPAGCLITGRETLAHHFILYGLQECDKTILDLLKVNQSDCRLDSLLTEKKEKKR